MVGGLRDAAGADFRAVLGGQYDVDRAELGQFGQHAARFVAQTGAVAELAEELPEHVGQEADQDVGQHAVLFLAPYRPQRQVALVDAAAPPRRRSIGWTRATSLHRSSRGRWCAARRRLR